MPGYSKYMCCHKPSPPPPKIVSSELRQCVLYSLTSPATPMGSTLPKTAAVQKVFVDYLIMGYKPITKISTVMLIILEAVKHKTKTITKSKRKFNQ